MKNVTGKFCGKLKHQAYVEKANIFVQLLQLELVSYYLDPCSAA